MEWEIDSNWHKDFDTMSSRCVLCDRSLVAMKSYGSKTAARYHVGRVTSHKLGK